MGTKSLADFPGSTFCRFQLHFNLLNRFSVLKQRNKCFVGFHYYLKRLYNSYACHSQHNLRRAKIKLLFWMKTDLNCYFLCSCIISPSDSSMLWGFQSKYSLTLMCYWWKRTWVKWHNQRAPPTWRTLGIKQGNYFPEHCPHLSIFPSLMTSKWVNQPSQN